MATSIPLATLVQKASEPLMNSLERRKGWVDGHESSTLPCATHARFGEGGDTWISRGNLLHEQG